MTWRTGLFFLGVALLFASSTFATEAREIRGRLVGLDSIQNAITLKTEVLGLSGPEKKDVSFSLAKDVNWTICLTGQCAEEKGVDGFRMLNEYAAFEAYGLSPKGCSVTLEQAGSTITGVRVNLR